MVATVYIWNKDAQGGVGHAAIDVSGSHCSFWPGGNGYDQKNAITKARVPSYNMPDYNSDVASEGRHADHAITIHGLDENAMMRKWNEIKNQSYSFGDRNCAACVADLLKAGSGMKPDFAVRAYPSEYMSTQGLNAYVAKMARTSADAYAITTQQHKVWTPEAARSYAAGLPYRMEQREIARQEKLAQDTAARAAKQARKDSVRSPKRRSSRDSDSDQSYHSARSHLSNYSQGESQGQSQGHSRR